MDDQQKIHRLTILTLCVIALVSCFSLTVTTFAYGTEKTTFLFLFLYPILVISTILIIAKNRFGIILSLLSSIVYCFLLFSEVGKYLVFNFDNSVLLWVLLLPYLSFLFIILTSVLYLFWNRKILKIIGILIFISFLILPIAERYNKDYSENIFIDAEIKNGKVILTCKPGFGDSRNFILESESKILAEKIKTVGEFYQGSYFLQNCTIVINYQFSELKQISLTEIGAEKVSPKIVWSVKNVSGDFSFLRP
jgi:hypothetical protein